MTDIICPKSPHGFAANCYIIISDRTVSVVDPTVPYSELYDGYEPGFILLTHCHFDHILEIDSWAERGFTVVASEWCKIGLSDPDTNCYRLFMGADKGYRGEVKTVTDGEIINVGDSEIRVMSTPGHTEGSLTYLLGDRAFVGDTAFAEGGFGRWDLPGGDFDKLRASLRKICGLPGHTVLYTGHGNRTAVWEYKQQITKRML